MRHPLHPALVHFPIACWSLATAGDLASPFLGEPAWRLSGMLHVAGSALALPAMLAGFVELLKVAEDSPAIKIANRHMAVVMTAFCFYAASLFLRLDGTTLQAPGPIETGLGVAGFACLAVAGWLGGRLVYEFGVGRSKSAGA